MLESHDEEKRTDPVEFFIKKLLKVTKGSSDFQDNLLRECVREFPYKESAIFYQMVSSLSRSNSPSALSLIKSIINGQTGFSDSEKLICNTCGEENPTKKCSRCKSVQYCDKECQKLHWLIHKKNCGSKAAEV